MMILIISMPAAGKGDKVHLPFQLSDLHWIFGSWLECISRLFYIRDQMVWCSRIHHDSNMILIVTQFLYSSPG